MKIAALIIGVVCAVVAAFVFIPAVQGLIVPMPGMLNEMVRESEAKQPVEGEVHRDLVYRESWAGRRSSCSCTAAPGFTATRSLFG